MTVLSPMMTKQQLAAKLGVSEQTLAIYREKYSEMPQPLKLGGRTYFRREEIETWIKSFLPSSKKAAR